MGAGFHEVREPVIGRSRGGSPCPRPQGSSGRGGQHRTRKSEQEGPLKGVSRQYEQQVCRVAGQRLHTSSVPLLLFRGCLAATQGGAYRTPMHPTQAHTPP
jgi:hypothetical protein